MRTGRRPSTVACLAAAAAVLALAAVVAATRPTGTYSPADITGKIQGGGLSNGFDLVVTKFKLQRTKIRVKAFDDDLDVAIKVDMRLRDRVDLEDENQVLRVESGTISIKDLATGTPLIWDGDFNNATYNLRLKSNGDWKITHRRKLVIDDLLGLTGYPYDGGRVKSVRVRAFR
jgi:hypothetical protein